jgi:hypothetical protein
MPRLQGEPDAITSGAVGDLFFAGTDGLSPTRATREPLRAARVPAAVTVATTP